MSIEIRLPALSPTTTDADLVKWHVNERDTVSAGDIIAEIETDKAVVDVEAPEAGTIARIVVPEGTEGVAIDAVIAVLEPATESCLDISRTAESVHLVSRTEPIAEQVSKPEPIPATADASYQAITTTIMSTLAPDARPASSELINASPLALHMAAQLRLDLALVRGSGPNNRITKADVEAAVTLSQTSSARVSDPAAAPSRQSPQLPPEGEPTPRAPFEPAFELRPLRKMRKTIAQRLSHSKQRVPHFYLSVDCSLDQVMALRKQFSGRSDKECRPSLNDIVIKAAAAALRKVPTANACWSDEGIKVYRSVDIAVAVALDSGLITPVIRDADHKELRAISAEMKELVSKARDGKLRQEQYRGGTFSISNLGMYGIKQFEAVIDPTQACILAVGMAEKRPVVRNETVEVATLMTCTLSADHRVLDGAVAAELLSVFKQYIEEPVGILF